jgi:hypothetical protein
LVELGSRMWEVYVRQLKKSHIKEDTLVWLRNIIGGSYTLKLGYKFLCENPNPNEEEWW